MRITSLDGLRGVAAVVVLIHHALMLLPTYHALEYRTPVRADPLAALLTFTPLHIVWAGDEAVVLFFVLSGLALTIPVLRYAEFRWRSYYPNRVVRLYLPVVAAVALAAALYVLSPWASDEGTVERLSASGAVQVASLVTGSPSFLDTSLWSLHWEVLFSLLLPLYVLFARRSGRHWIGWSVVAIACSTAGWLLHVQAVMYLSVFVLGVLLAAHPADRAAAAARIARSRHPRFWWTAIVVGAICAVTLGWYPLPATLSRVVGYPVLLVGAVTLVFAAEHCPGMRRLLEARPVHWLGVVSFSLYLVHAPLIAAIDSALPAGLAHTPLSMAIGVPASILVAWLFFLVIERPSHRLARRVGRRFHESSAALHRASAAEPSAQGHHPR